MNIKYPVGLISNNNAKKNKKTIVDSKELMKILGGTDRCLLRDTSSLEELKDVIGEFRKKKISVIFSNGGDGTHQKLISTLIYNYRDYSPYIIPLKSGTMNMLSKNLGFNVHPHKAVRWFKMMMDENKRPTVTSKHILEITTEGDERPKYGFVFIAGCAYKLLNLYYSYPEGGKRNATKAIFSSMVTWLTKNEQARMIYSYTPSKMVIDAKEFEFPYLITVASSLENLVLGFSPFALKRLKDDRFFFMIDGEPMKKNYNFIKFFKPTDNEEWKTKRLVSKANTMTLHVDGGYSVDGEIVKLKDHKARVEVKKGPKINFITPVLN